MDDRRPLASTPASARSSIGRRPCSATHSSISRRCSQAWMWTTIPARLGVAGDLLEPPARARPHAVRREADPPGMRGGEVIDAPQVGGDVGIAEPALARRRREARTGPLVGGHEQHDLDAGVGGSGHRRLGHRVGGVIRRPVRPVVRVVELAHRHVPRGAHLAVGERAPPRGPSRDRAARPRRTSPRATSRSRRAGARGRRARPRRAGARWKAWLWAFTKPGRRSARHRVSFHARWRRSPGNASSTGSPSWRTSAAPTPAGTGSRGRRSRPRRSAGSPRHGRVGRARGAPRRRGQRCGR